MDYALHLIMRAGPIALGSSIGCALGTLAGRHRFKRWNDRARENLVRLRADLAHDLDGAMDRMWCQIGRVMMEIAVIDRLWARGRVTASGTEHVTAARAAGRPVLVIGVHLANWEVIAPTLTRLVQPLYFIYQPPRNRFQHRLATNARRRCGATVLAPSLTSTRRAWRALVEERASLLMFVDELVDGRVNAPAFGRPLRARGNLANVVRLARASGAAVIPAHVARREGTRFHVTFEPPVTLAGRDDDDLMPDVARLDALIEPIVLAQLLDWHKLHDLRFDR
ncbi:MAG: lysophospholipid acyltransferase family protein [Alphaproteobacteria bacterium]|nr:lysophospholipid acyltransferase family protein [Alphaproteobacteria bacterium]